MQKWWQNPFERKSVLLICFLFFGGFLAANRLHNALCEKVIHFPCVRFWPISVVLLRVPPNIDYPNALHIAVAIGSIILLLIALRTLHHWHFRIAMVFIFGLLLILTSTLTHGFEFGFARSVAGMGVAQYEYYNDAIQIDDPYAFLQEFNRLQPNLYVHSRTHPPFAVLAFYYLNVLLQGPGRIALTIAVLSTCLSAYCFQKLFSREFSNNVANSIVFVYLLIPAVQIYYSASLDALIAACGIGSLIFLISNSRTAWTISILCTILFSLFSFGFLFLLPVIALFELWEYRSIRRSILAISSIALVHLLVYWITEFNYLDSFLTASKLENPNGFKLLSSPETYWMTRIEGISEVAFFLGPFLLILLFRGFQRMKVSTPLMKISALGIASFFLMLLTGAYRTGETARAALFIYPFLLIPIGYEIERLHTDNRSYNTLAWMVFIQTLLMQLVGDYFW